MTNRSSFILELDTVVIQAVAQMLHMRLMEDDAEVAKRGLGDLRHQTNIVNMDPRRHSVYESDLVSPANAVRFEGKFYVPIK